MKNNNIFCGLNVLKFKTKIYNWVIYLYILYGSKYIVYGFVYNKFEVQTLNSV